MTRRTRVSRDRLGPQPAITYPSSNEANERPGPQDSYAGSNGSTARVRSRWITTSNWRLKLALK